MNAEQRKRIAEIEEELSTLLDEIETIKDDEESKYDNLPESLQNGEKGDALQEGIDTLDSAYSSLSDAIDYIRELI